MKFQFCYNMTEHLPKSVSVTLSAIGKGKYKTLVSQGKMALNVFVFWKNWLHTESLESFEIMFCLSCLLKLTEVLYAIRIFAVLRVFACSYSLRRI